MLRMLQNIPEVWHLHVVHTNRNICIWSIGLTFHCYAFCFIYCVHSGDPGLAEFNNSVARLHPSQCGSVLDQSDLSVPLQCAVWWPVDWHERTLQLCGWFYGWLSHFQSRGPTICPKYVMFSIHGRFHVDNWMCSYYPINHPNTLLHHLFTEHNKLWTNHKYYSA